MEAADIWALFAKTYLDTATPLRYVEHHLFEDGKAQGIRMVVTMDDGTTRTLTGEGNGPIDAAVHALSTVGIAVEVRSYEERSMGKGGDARACAFMEVTRPGGERDYFGVGMDGNIVTASIKALISGVNRLHINGAATPSV